MNETNNRSELWPGWETVSQIGSGSFGTVYEIRRELLGETERAALKVISIPRSESEMRTLTEEGYDRESLVRHYRSLMEEIVREYRLMARMRGNSTIVDCDDLRYEQHEDGIGWTIYIKMELLTPMPQTMKQTYDEQETLRVGTDLCSALMLCARYHIVHRDIKPQNIFVSGVGHYKLGDFGIAKVSEHTTNGTRIGTLKFMAPEVFNGQPYGARSDLYSVGMVLYWMMNDMRLPFLPPAPEVITAEMEQNARICRFRGDPLPRPVNGSEALWAIVRKACAHHAEDRYETPEEMLADLRLLQDDPTATLRKAAVPREYLPPEPGREDAAEETTLLPPPASRRKKRVWPILLFLFAAAAAALLWQFFGREQKAQEPESPPEETVQVGSEVFQGHHYEIFLERDILTWEDAQRFCEEQGGHLAVITSEEENDFLRSCLDREGFKSAYFGFSDAANEGEWEWVTGEEVTYTNWYENEPNNDLGNEDYAGFYFLKDSGSQWFDGDFGDQSNGGKAFICEWDH